MGVNVTVAVLEHKQMIGSDGMGTGICEAVMHCKQMCCSDGMKADAWLSWSMGS